MPAAALANHGAATISTKVSTTSLRHTNELHSGCSPARDAARRRPTSPTDGEQRGDQRRRRAARRPDARPRPPERRARRRAMRARRARRRRWPPSTPPARSGTARRRRAATRRRGGGRERAARRRRRRRVRRSFTGGLPSHDVPGLRLLRRRRQHGDEPVLRAPTRPPAAMPELPRKARLPTLARRDPQPPAAELVAGDHRVVGEEGAVADRRHLRQQQHRRRLDARADRRPRGRAATPA